MNMNNSDEILLPAETSVARKNTLFFLYHSLGGFIFVTNQFNSYQLIANSTPTNQSIRRSLPISSIRTLSVQLTD